MPMRSASAAIGATRKKKRSSCSPKGGVVGATSLVNFLPTGFDTTVEDLVDAIDDMVERIGVDHVAIGTDSTHDQPLAFWRYIGSQQGTKFPSTFLITRKSQP